MLFKFVKLAAHGDVGRDESVTLCRRQRRGTIIGGVRAGHFRPKGVPDAAAAVLRSFVVAAPARRITQNAIGKIGGTTPGTPSRRNSAKVEPFVDVQTPTLPSRFASTADLPLSGPFRGRYTEFVVPVWHMVPPLRGELGFIVLLGLMDYKIARISARLGRQFIGLWRPEATPLNGSALPRGFT